MVKQFASFARSSAFMLILTASGLGLFSPAEGSLNPTNDRIGGAVTVSRTLLTGADCLAPPAGLVSWWPLDENANDVWGGNLGTLFGNPSFVAGKVAQGLRFDGIDDHVRVPASAGLNVGLSSGFTMETWIQPDDTQPRPVLEYNNEAGMPGVHLWVNYPSAGALIANITDTTGIWHFIGAADVLTVSAFRHVALTYDKPSGVARLFVDGAEKANANLGSFTPQTSYPFFIGLRLPAGDTGSIRYRGLIDEVSIFDRPLSANEIRAIFNADSAGKCRRVAGCPAITGLNPASGRAGETITLTGTNLMGVTAVKFSDNVAAQFSVVSDAQITATVPNGAVTGLITVSKPNCPDAQTNRFTISADCLTPPAGLVSWWAFDGNANDIWNGNPGTLHGPPSFVASKVAQGLRFDGVDDHVRVASSASPNVGLSAGFTMEAWIQPDDTQPRPVLEYNNETGMPGVHLWINFPNARTLIANITDTAGIWHFIEGPDALTVGVFRHVALTYDKTSGVARLFVDGAEKANASLGSFTPQTSYPFFIGLRLPAGGTGSFRYKGLVDEVSLFDRPLSASEIRAIFNAGSAGKCKRAGDCPAITGLNPASGAVGSNVTITGASFTGITAVKFSNSVPAAFTVVNDATISATVPIGAMNGPIVLSKPGCSDVATGTFTVSPGIIISGNVRYCITADPVASATLTATNATGVVVIATTSDRNGRYALGGLSPGFYVVTPAKADNFSGLSAFDAARIAQHVQNINRIENVCQVLAADANRDGMLTTTDALTILGRIVGLPEGGQVGKWIFRPESRSSHSLSNDQFNQDYDAVLIGDVTGNWARAASLANASVEMINDGGGQISTVRGAGFEPGLSAVRRVHPAPGLRGFWQGTRRRRR